MAKVAAALQDPKSPVLVRKRELQSVMARLYYCRFLDTSLQKSQSDESF